MLTEAAKQQLVDCCRLGFRNQYGEEIIFPDFKINNEWESMILHEGTFCSLDLKRFYVKDEQIKTNDKWSIKYRGFIMPVLDKDVFVIQCITGDFVVLRIIGEKDDIEELESMVRKDTEFDLDMSFEDFKEANRRDLEFHKRIKTFEANFNKAPERFDIQGNVITSLDHFDNYEYMVIESNEQIYQIYNAETEKRRLENRLIYLEEKKFDYDYCIDEKYIEDAIDAIMSLYPSEVEKYFTKGGEYIFNNINTISFETELTKGQVWKAWKYMNWIEIEKEIQDINKMIDELEECMDVGKTKVFRNEDDDVPYLFRNLSKTRIVRK